MSKGHPLHVVYEAGPCGFVIWRHLHAQGIECQVVASSSIPKRAGDRIKTDRRDAMLLARLSRSGDLAPVRVPGAADEAVRDLVRAREDAVRECRNARHRLKALLLRNGIAHAGKSSWTAAHLRWLTTLKLAHAAQQIGFQEYLHAISKATARIARLEQAMRECSAWAGKVCRWMRQHPPEPARQCGREGKEQGGDAPSNLPEAGGGTRRSRGHWGTLENVIGGHRWRQRPRRDLSP